MKYATRGLLTLLVLLAAFAVNALLAPRATLVQGAAAGAQMANSDAGALGAAAVFAGFNLLGMVLTAIVVIALVAIWWLPVVALLRRGGAPALAGLALLSLAAPAQAYFEQTDKTEAYTILPNESAFWIPDTGANKDSQVNFDSEDYLRSNKIAAKRFVIPHAKLSNSGGMWGWDSYVPTGRLIIVDRSPYSREWVAPAVRGTSARDESIPCQSKEGLNITVGVSIGASVAEASSPRYLYHFGVVAPQGSRSDPQVIFASVYYARRLSDVMDDIGRKKVQTLVCRQIAARAFDAANAEANQIMDAVQKEATDYFATLGITLDFVGWADTFTFDPLVQKAINDRYIAATVGPSLPVLEAQADIKVKEGLGAGLQSHGLPATLLSMGANWLDSLLGKPAAPAK